MYEPTFLFPTIFENEKRINSYYIGSNPAFLQYEDSDELLSIQASFNSFGGDFRKFICPNDDRLYQLRASGKKYINEDQVFKGSFGFQRIERRDWCWLVTKNYSLGSPFLLGDSSLGSTRYNGIVMNAEWGSVFWKKFMLGFSFNYNVDEGLKEVIPRPTSEHRDINIGMGTGFIFYNSLVGLAFNIFDNNERIGYREDSEDILKETILYKFRGYDYPGVIKKKVETRFSYHNGYVGLLTYSYRSKDNLFFASSFGGGVEHLIIKDEALDPRPEGYWKNNILEARLQIYYRMNKNYSIGFQYNFIQNNMWARHQIFSSLMSEKVIPNHIFKTVVKNDISTNVKVAIEIGLDYLRITENDYYSNISWKVIQQKFESTIGFEILWFLGLQTTSFYGFQKQIITDESLINSIQSEYFYIYRIKDIVYYQTNVDKHSINTKISIDIPSLGPLDIFLKYTVLIPMNSIYFKKSRWSEIETTVEYKIKAY